MYLCIVSPAYTFLTLDVIEAMCSCLIAEAEVGEQSHRSDAEQELRIVSEFGRCLTQVIDSASRTRGMWQHLSFHAPCGLRRCKNRAHSVY